MAYKHGVYVAEQGTSIVAPVTATAGLQVVIGTAPINRASDPYHCTNTPMLANTLAGATAAVAACGAIEYLGEPRTSRRAGAVDSHADKL